MGFHEAEQFLLMHHPAEGRAHERAARIRRFAELRDGARARDERRQQDVLRLRRFMAEERERLTALQQRREERRTAAAAAAAIEGENLIDAVFNADPQIKQEEPMNDAASDEMDFSQFNEEDWKKQTEVDEAAILRALDPRPPRGRAQDVMARAIENGRLGRKRPLRARAPEFVPRGIERANPLDEQAGDQLPLFQPLQPQPVRRAEPMNAAGDELRMFQPLQPRPVGRDQLMEAAEAAMSMFPPLQLQGLLQHQPILLPAPAPPPPPRVLPVREFYRAQARARGVKEEEPPANEHLVTKVKWELEEDGSVGW